MASPYYIINTLELPKSGAPPGLDPAQVSATVWAASPMGLTPSGPAFTDGVGGALRGYSDRPIAERQAANSGAPIIDRIAPTSVLHGVAAVVTITGTRLSGATAVAIGGVGTAITVVNDTTLRVTTPVLSVAGSPAVTVTTPAGTSPNAYGFTYT
jgi:hypothetical protein